MDSAVVISVSPSAMRPARASAMTTRWSLCPSTQAPFSLLSLTTRPSLSSSISAPIFLSSWHMTLIRSVSLMRAWGTLTRLVSPLATQPSTAMAGRASGVSFKSISAPSSSAVLIRTPPPSSSISAPICLTISNTFLSPWGSFMSSPLMSTSESCAMRAPMRGKVAEE